MVFYKETDGKVIKFLNTLNLIDLLQLVGVLMLNMFGPAIDVARRLIDDKAGTFINIYTSF